ncbi:MAG: Epoxide hydrolase, partial [uncultured Rubrobacteraceae bacterium]
GPRAVSGSPLRRPWRGAAALRRGGGGAARGALARLPGVLVLLEVPDPRAGGGRLPRRGPRHARLQPLGQAKRRQRLRPGPARAGRGAPDRGPGRRARRGRRARLGRDSGLGGRDAPPGAGGAAGDPERAPPRTPLPRAADPAPAPQELLRVLFSGPVAPGEDHPGRELRHPAVRLPQRPGTAGCLRRGRHRPVRRGALAPGGAHGHHKLLPGPRQASARPDPGVPAPDRGAGVGDLGREGHLPRPGAGPAEPRLGPRRPRRAPARRQPLGPARPPREGQRPAAGLFAWHATRFLADAL